MILPSGLSAYTRDGALKRDGDGLIVTSEGNPVVPEITIPADFCEDAVLSGAFSGADGCDSVVIGDAALSCASRCGELLPTGVPVTFSPCDGQVTARDLPEWILQDGLPVRFQIQLHKAVWPDRDRGV